MTDGDDGGCGVPERDEAANDDGLHTLLENRRGGGVLQGCDFERESFGQSLRLSREFDCLEVDFRRFDDGGEDRLDCGILGRT